MVFVLSVMWLVLGSVFAVIGGAPDAAAYVLAPLLTLIALGMHVYSARYETAMHVEGDAVIVRTAAFGAPRHRNARAPRSPKVP